MTPCQPSQPTTFCAECTRKGEADDNEPRIDGTVLTKPGGLCPFRMPLVRSSDIEAYLRDEGMRQHG